MDSIKPSERLSIHYLDDIVKDILIIKEFLNKNPDKNLLKLFDFVIKESGDNIYQELLYLSVSLNNVSDKIKKYEEIKNLF